MTADLKDRNSEIAASTRALRDAENEENRARALAEVARRAASRASERSRLADERLRIATDRAAGLRGWLAALRNGEPCNGVGP